MPDRLSGARPAEATREREAGNAKGEYKGPIGRFWSTRNGRRGSCEVSLGSLGISCCALDGRMIDTVSFSTNVLYLLFQTLVKVCRPKMKVLKIRGFLKIRAVTLQSGSDDSFVHPTPPKQ